MKALLALAAALIIAAAPARAAFEDLGYGARAPGMGNAFTALADDAYAVYYNPAGLTQLERPQLSASYAQLYTGLNDGSSLGTSQLVYAHPLDFGRNGTIAAGWQRFSLSSLYTEQTLHLSYGHSLHESEDGSHLLLGGSAKYLQHSFGATAEATSACSNGQCSGLGSDPVLTGSKSKGAPDLDLGLLYRLPRRFQVGLMIEHLMEPNVGFSGADKVQRNMHLGAAYKSLWMNLVGELQFNKAPDGSTDKDLTLAAERFFPTLDYGQFGVRGSLGFGSRDWKQLTIGGSYRVNKIQFDYGYLMPIGVFGGGGSHRLALTLHFGAPNAEDEMAKEVLEKSRQARAHGSSGYGYEYQANLRPHDLEDPSLSEIRELIEGGHYRAAHQRLSELTAGQPAEPSIEKLLARLDIVSQHYADIPRGGDRADAALLASAKQFVRGRDNSAMLNASYAAALKPSDARLDQYLAHMEKETGIKATRIPPDSQRGFIDEELYQVEAAHNRGDNNRAVKVLQDVLELEPDNTVALERLGSAYFLQHQYQPAIETWQKALPLEKRQAEADSLRQYIGQAQQAAGKTTLPGGLEKPAGAAPAAPEAAEPEAQAPAPIAIPSRAARGSGDPRDVASLYQKGVEFYARGEYLQAAAMFMRILQIDPRNEEARKALERIQRAQTR